MFTGIIKAVGRIDRMRPQGGDVRLRVDCTDLDWPSFELGESISVNGVCLTAVELDSNGFSADVSTETLDVTALSTLDPGARVNLEPALAVGERLGGHLVSGHVDCVGRLRTREADARSVRLVFELPAEYSRYVARKGSICIDGVSLTVNEVSADTFGVNIIPHTADATIIGEYREGREVNIEVDLLARYLERLLGGEQDSTISKDFLKAHGYA